MSELERLKLKAKGKLAASKIEDLPLFQQTTRLGQMVQTGPWLENLFSPDLLAAMNLLGAFGTQNTRPQPQLLLSFPHKKEWSLGGLNWHLDLTPPKKGNVPGVQAFVLIDDVRMHGGGTLALAGSHRLHDLPEARNGGIHALLRRDPVFYRLFEGSVDSPDELLVPRTIHGIPVSIVEMCGKAGDVFLMDMRVLHSPSINATGHIRMMATSRLMRKQ